MNIRVNGQKNQRISEKVKGQVNIIVLYPCQLPQIESYYEINLYYRTLSKIT